MDLLRRSRLVALPLLLPGPAEANAGAPMLFVILPEMLLLLIPVVFLEARVLARRLGLTRGRSIRLSAVANLISTLIGVPLTWGALLFVQLNTVSGDWVAVESVRDAIVVSVLQAPWIVHAEETWVLVVAVTVLYAAFFAVSWLIEFWYVRFVLGRQGARGTGDTTAAGAIRRAVLVANVQSYALMYGVLVYFALIPVIRHLAGV